MNSHSRRNALKLLGLGSIAAATAMPSITRSATNRVVVVGGGFAGATVAKYLKHWSSATEVILIEPNGTYYSPILSNLVLTQHLDLGRITLGYATLVQKYGVNYIADYVNSVDSAAQTVSLRGGSTLAYDRLVLAPGIDFDLVEGLDIAKIPHAWQAGAQTIALQQQLAAIPTGGTFVMTIPPAPFRCPPGPYERACAVAEFMETRKAGGNVIVLDANADIIAGKSAFSHAFSNIYGKTIEYHTNVQLQSVDSDQRIAKTSIGNFQADVLNVIPTQRAGNIIQASGLANDPTGRWAQVNPLNYQSTAAANIHIIGDSQGTGQPKAGHIANSEAKICADAILRSFAGQAPYPAPVTNSACYSPITASTASWLTAAYSYNPATGGMQAIPGSAGASSTISAHHFNTMFDWTGNLFNDSFA